MRHYLDHNATTPVLPAAAEAMARALALVGNPSSVHAEGRAARAAVENARSEVAALVNGAAENVVFTSGATEALQALILEGVEQTGAGPARRGAGGLIHSAAEHAAVLAAAERLGAEGAPVLSVPVDAFGRVSPEAVAARLAMLDATHPILHPVVLIQFANNETGVIQDLAAIAAPVRAAGAVLVVDAVQAPGRLPLDIGALGADALVLSAHKFGGPKGVGAIVFADRATRLGRAFIVGGGQERGQRGGTENVPGIVGMGAAAAHARLRFDALAALRDAFERGLRDIAPDAVIFGEGAPRLGNTSAFAIPGLASEKMLISLDLAGVALSSGSACSSGKVRPSHVLAAMGVPDALARCALRASFGAGNNARSVVALLEGLARGRAGGKNARNTRESDMLAVSQTAAVN